MAALTKVAIIGASGFLGTKLIKKLDYRLDSASSYEVIGTYYNNPKEGMLDLDIQNERAVTNFMKEYNPEVVVISATIQGAKCEEDPDLAERVIINGAKNFVRACSSSGSKLIFTSTDYIWPGKESLEESPYTEDSPPNPINVYGYCKTLAEEEVLKLGSNSLVVRLSSMYGWNGNKERNSFLGFLKSLKGEIKMGTYQRKHEVWVDDVSLAIIGLLTANASGVYNIAGPEMLSKYDLTQRLLKLCPNITRVIPDSNIRGSFNIPKNLPMSTAKIESLGITFSSVEEAVEHILRQTFR